MKISLTEAFARLSEAEAVIVTSDSAKPVIYPAVAELTGDPLNEFLYVGWDVDGLGFSVRALEGANQDVDAEGSSLTFFDDEGDAFTIELLVSFRERRENRKVVPLIANALWFRDSIQFPRLIAELSAAGFLQGPQEGDENSESRWQSLYDSMNLDHDAIDELIDRAERAWDVLTERTISGSLIEHWLADQHVPPGSADAIYRVIRENDNTVVALVDPNDEDAYPMGLAELIATTPDLDGALREFVQTIEVTGGVVKLDSGLYAPVGDKDWIDLGEAYNNACKALRREAMVEGDDETDN